MLQNKRILALAPHTDDVELGCGGSIAKWLESGSEVRVAVFSIARQSVPTGYSETVLRDEFIDSMSRLGVGSGNSTIYDFPVRRLTEHRQDILELIVGLKKLHSPDLILVPSLNDIHQDHQVIANEALRVARSISVIAYELPWNMARTSTSMFVGLEKRHLESKICSLEAYRSQLSLERPYFDPAFLEGLARVRGVQAGVRYAEGFEVIRITT